MCRKSYLGNCDPLTADGEYCIFHKPNKTEEEGAEFRERFLEVFGARTWRGSLDEEIKDVTVFTKPVDARGYVFPKDFDLRNSQIDRADFSNAVFNNVNFSGSDFGEVIFSGATFIDADFSDSKFGNADFSRARIKRANFQRSEFMNGNFSESKIDSSNFVATKFKRASFREAKMGRVDFTGAVMDHANFSNSLMEDARFTGTRFGDANFSWSEFKRADFSHSRFKRRLTFDNAIFKEKFSIIPLAEDLGESPVSIEKKLFSQKERDCEIGKARFCHPQPMAEAAKVQRIMYEKIGDRNKADLMFVLEMRARRKLRVASSKNPLAQLAARVFNFFEWIIADFPSRYGTDWMRLMMVTLLTIFLYGLIYWAVGTHTDLGGIHYSVPPYSEVSELRTVLYYSLVTFTTLGYGDLYPTGILRAVSSVEAFTGAVFMALIVAVIARKWMR